MEEVGLQKILAKLPSVESLGLNKAREGPPLPRGAKWPKPIREFAEQHWPGVPIPREWGEKTMKRLPLGIGKAVQGIVDKLGL